MLMYNSVLYYNSQILLPVSNCNLSDQEGQGNWTLLGTVLNGREWSLA